MVETGSCSGEAESTVIQQKGLLKDFPWIRGEIPKSITDVRAFFFFFLGGGGGGARLSEGGTPVLGLSLGNQRKPHEGASIFSGKIGPWKTKGPTK